MWVQIPPRVPRKLKIKEDFMENKCTCEVCGKENANCYWTFVDIWNEGRTRVIGFDYIHCKDHSKKEIEKFEKIKIEKCKKELNEG